MLTTNGFVNDGFLDDELVTARAILNGEDESLSAERYLPWLYTQDSEIEIFKDERTWIKSNPMLGEIKRIDYLRREVDKAKRSTADRVFVLCKDFNIKQSFASKWLMKEDYDYDCPFELEDFRGKLALGAVDLSFTTDLTCAKVMFMKPDSQDKYIHSMYFIPEEKYNNAKEDTGADYKQWVRDGFVRICPGNDVDLQMVADWFAELYRDYQIRIYRIGYDNRFAKQFVNAVEDYGFEVEMILQNGPTMSNANRLLESDIKSQRVVYNDNPVDRWCLGNTTIKITDDMGNFVLAKTNNPMMRIDGAVTKAILYETFRRFRTDFVRNVK